MTEPVTSITSAFLREVETRIQQPASWPDPASGFAFRVLQASGQPIPAAYREPTRSAGVQLLRRSPDLAAFGYVIPQAPAQVQLDWSQAFSRLMGREAFPADRNSFIYNPIELLGIAYGATECPHVTDQQRQWLLTQIERGFSEKHFASQPAELFAQCAWYKLSPADVSRRVPAIGSGLPTNTSDLSMMTALAVLFPDVETFNVAAAENQILHSVLAEPIEAHDVAEAAALYVTLHRAIDRTLRAPNLNSDPVERIVALCRRFQVFVDRLQHRQRSRPAFSVQDEYDVQDLLHAVLKLHFDDVRPEEWTPSYAGNSSRVDFYLKRERTIVEAKMTRKGLNQKEVANQLIIDKERYTAVDNVDNLVCFVYDPERHCANPAALETDLEQLTGKLRVAVVVCPTGI
jgi:hypothetical protein